jgi:tRNA threonylcarbamoyladenosine biosynthesis protein TsaE
VTRYSQDEATYQLDIISHSTAQTQRLAARLGDLLHGGELILLGGDLGTGKTTFTQGLAKGLCIDAVVSSPTFTLLKEYPGQPLPPEETQPGMPRQGMPIGPSLYHFDLYRLDEAEEIFDLGFEDYFYGSGVCVVEWADRVNDEFWPAEKLHIRMKVLNETKRGLLFAANGARYCELLKQFQKNTYASASS